MLAWTSDIHLSGLVTDFLYYIPVLAFGTGLVFGFSFDTAGPRVRDRDVLVNRDRDVVQDTPTTTSDDRAADEPLTADQEATTTTTTDRTTDRETVR